MSQPRFTTVLVVTVLLLLAAIPQSSAIAWWPWSPPAPWWFDPYDVYIFNELTGNKVLYVQCRCTHGDRPPSYVNAGDLYHWSFKPHFLKKTVWSCYLKPDNVHYLDFVAYDRHTATWSRNVFWVAKDDGVYTRNPYGGDTLDYKWSS